MHRIHLTFPGTLSEAEAEILVIKYRGLYPDRYTEWVEIEKLRERLPPNGLREIQIHFIDFLKAHTTWDDSFALISAWVDARGVVVRDAYSQ